MKSLILNTETSNLTVQNLLKQIDSESVEVQDMQGNVVAFILSPADTQAWTYVEANFDLDRHEDKVRQTLKQRGGVTTAQLLDNAASAALENNVGQ